VESSSQDFPQSEVNMQRCYEIRDDLLGFQIGVHENEAHNKPPSPTSGKRKSLDKLEQHTPVSVSTPSNKRQKLAMRVKDIDFQDGHRRRQIEIRSPLQKTDGSTSDLEETQEQAQVPTKEIIYIPSSYVEADDQGEEPTEFYTPVEAPASNPLQLNETSSAAGPTEDGVEDEESSDDDAPPETMSTSQAASASLQAAQKAAKAADM